MYRYDAIPLAKLQDLHSQDRLGPYLSHAGTLGDAFELYVWNTVVASRFHGSLQAVEVGLRNACHRELSAYFHHPAWYQESAFLALDSELKGQVKSAKKAGPAPGDVVSHLYMFFWNKLFDPSLDPWLWNNVLRHVFTATAPRSPGAILAELEKVRDLRNRIAHLEPIYSRNLVDDIERIQRVSSWVHPTLEEWVRKYDVLTSVLSSRPKPGVEPPRGTPPWPLLTF